MNITRIFLPILISFALSACNSPSTQTTQQSDSTATIEQKQAITTNQTDYSKRYIDTIFTKAQIDTQQKEYMKGYWLTAYFVKAGLDTAKKKWVYCFLHGGGGDKDEKGGVAYSTYFAQLGYAAVSINYPVGEDFTPQKQKEAVYATWSCLQYLRSNATAYRLNPNIIFLQGSSAGGITVYQSSIGSWVSTDSYFREWATNPNNKGLPITVTATATISGAANPTFEKWIPHMKSPNGFSSGIDDLTVPYKKQKAQYELMVASRVYLMNNPIFKQATYQTGHNVGNFDSVSVKTAKQFYYAANPIN